MTARRADARGSRRALIAATARLLHEGRPLTMRAVADIAGVSRSTLYRHFRSPDELRRAVGEQAVADAREALERALAEPRPPLAQLRRVMAALVEARPPVPPPAEQLVTDGLRRLAERLGDAAGLVVPPGGTWLDAALAQFAEACLRADDVERLLGIVTDPLDRGLLLLEADGTVVTFNREAREALGDLEPGRRAVVRGGGLYEDGSPASPEAHPLSVALASGESREGVRGGPDGEDWWFVDVRVLRRDEPYGFVAVFTDVSREKGFELGHLRPPGQLRATTPPLLDVMRALDEVPPPLLPEQLVAEAMRITGGPVALYVLDIDGSHLLRLAGREDFPECLSAPLALGPELAVDGLSDLTAHLAQEMPGVAMAPMWLRGRAVGVLLALRDSQAGLREVARFGAAALELANGYTDVIDAARRRKPIEPAAEIQQSLIPPRIARLGSGEIAGGVMPSYEVGGDWFDYVENRDGAWLAIADASGRGPEAGALGGVALAALRAARRNGATLEQAVATMHETMSDVGGPEFFLTAIVARWLPVHSVFSWINCGHPPPLLVRADDTVEELATRPDLPLGVLERERTFHRHQRRLLDGDRLVLYSDGVTRRRTGDGLFGTEGVARAASVAVGRSATATARAIQEAVAAASENPLADDAAVVVLAVSAPG